ncbi:MAG TPA: radical SAM protein [bacterium]|nr:radical SAM protein [bacterium]HPS30640.1 radical SAM protein [bacterium]
MLRIGKKISYQFYEGFCVILNHADGNDYKLNSSASDIIKKIESEVSDLSAEELEFIDDLIAAGIVFDDNETENPEQNEIGNRTGIESSVWNELTDFASKNLIPISALIELTYRCPVKCSHCYIDRSEVTQKQELKFDKYTEFIDDFRKLGGLYLVFTGGDPLLHKDFEKIFNYARKNRIAVSIMSSGFKSDLKLLERISKLGIMSFQTSIHGHNSEVHDRFTGVAGSFETTLNTLRFMKELGVYVQAAVIINLNNIEFFDDIVNFLENEKINYVFNYEMFRKRNGDKAPIKLNISDDEIILCLSKTGDQGKPRLSGKMPEDAPCNAARSLVSLNPAGTVFPCLELRIPAGNIKNNRFSDIWNDSDVLKRIRQVKFKDLIDCPECELKSLCNRCAGSAFKEQLKIIEHSANDCKHAKLKQEILLQSLDKSGNKD